MDAIDPWIVERATVTAGQYNDHIFMNQNLDWLLESHGKNGRGEAQKYFKLATELEAARNLHGAATAFDRAYGLNPVHMDIEQARRQLLDHLAVAEKGLLFRYIPAGTFQMGSDTGETDEAPVHPVRLDAYWLSETPVSWAAYCSLMGWSLPPDGMPPQETLGESKSSGLMKKVINSVLQRSEKTESGQSRSDAHCSREQDPPPIL